MYVVFVSLDRSSRLIDSNISFRRTFILFTTARLPENVTEEQLEEVLSRYGKISSVRLPPDSLHQRSHRGYGFVTFENAEDARECVSKDVYIGELKLQIDYARDNTKGSSRFRPYGRSPSPPSQYPPRGGGYSSYGNGGGGYYAPPQAPPVDYYRDPYYQYPPPPSNAPYPYDPRFSYGGGSGAPPSDPYYRGGYMQEAPRVKRSPVPSPRSAQRDGYYEQGYYNARPAQYDDYGRNAPRGDRRSRRSPSPNGGGHMQAYAPRDDRRDDRKPLDIRHDERRPIEPKRDPSKRDDLPQTGDWDKL